MAHNCALRNIGHTSRCFTTRSVFSLVICKSRISVSATCSFPRSKDSGNGVSDDSKTRKEYKYSYADSEKMPEPKENPPFDHSRGPSFLDRHKKMQPLSPMKRLASVLPQEYTNSLDNFQNDESHIKDGKSSSSHDVESSKSGFGSKDSQALRVAGRFRGVLPSQRLSKMIPSAYWEEVDKDTKSIVKNIGVDSFNDEGKSNKNPPET